LRAIEDDVDADMLSQVIAGDPFMTLKVLAFVAANRRTGSETETETVTSSLLMTGIGPFFRAFGPQPTVQSQLREHPEALLALQGLLHRADRAANFALAFAVHRGDPDAAAIHQAAFLHDFVEMLVWCNAPALQLQIQNAQRADASLRSAAIQRKVLNIDHESLRRTLMRLWRLPELLIRISDPRHMELANVRNVELAVRLARHTALGWENAAIPDDIRDIAQLLNALPRVAMAFVRKVDADHSQQCVVLTFS
jgi:HD-like signal output (HDOD) protein